MYKCKTKWDCFCELLTAVPGVAAMFDDARAGTPAEAAFIKSKEAEERLKGKGGGSHSDLKFDDAAPSAPAGWEKGDGVGDALVEGAREVEDTVKEGLGGLKGFVRNRI